MNPPKHIVEINGLKYDATSGKLISPRPVSPISEPGQVISDMVGANSAPAQKIQITPPKPKKTTSHRASSSETGRKPDRSHTLMRPAVKKPTHKSEVKKTQPKLPKTEPAYRARLERAQSVQKSNLIKRFHAAKPKQAGVTPQARVLEVKAPPAPITPPPSQPNQEQWPVIDQFERAMQEASSHLETFVEKTTSSKKRRKLAYVLVSLSALFVIGFGAYQVVPMAKVKLAGNKAGFSPDLPRYSPAGYSLADPVQADYGQVTLSYKSRTDDKGFKLTQAPSEWNSQSLVSNFLVSSNKDYRTVKGNGQTIYTYDGSDATWVDSGIWYKVEGNAKLNDEQLLKIANSL